MGLAALGPRTVRTLLLPHLQSYLATLLPLTSQVQYSVSVLSHTMLADMTRKHIHTHMDG